MLKLENLTVGVDDKIILQNINYEFEKNKVYAIMGPNGSGKSTLGFTIAGHPAYEVKNGRIVFQGEDITEEDPDKRAKKGIFLSFQSPLQLSGVNVVQLLRVALEGKIDPLDLKKKVEEYARILDIRKELIERSLNEGASGGERKKLELLQAAILDPKLVIFDEIDTGVDVDALRKIGEFINEFKKGRAILLITHYSRILKYIEPDRTLVIMNGKLAKEGDGSLAHLIEEKGYKVVNDQ